MAERRRFAAGTLVPCEKTRAELERLLGKHGASQIAVATDNVARRGQIVFALSKRMVRLSLSFCVPKPPLLSTGAAR